MKLFFDLQVCLAAPFQGQALRLGKRMKIFGKASIRGIRRLILRQFIVVCLAVASVGAASLAAQTLPAQTPAQSPAAQTKPNSSPPPAQASTESAAAPVPLSATAVLNLDGPWRFQKGDDLRWSDPAFDDSKWPTVTLSQPLINQVFESYSGYAWYRMRIQPQQLAAFGNLNSNLPPELFVTGDSVGQLSVFINNIETGHSSGMAQDPPSDYQSPPFIATLSAPDATGARLIAIRTWANPDTIIRRGLLARVELGTHADIADRLATALGRQWNEHVISALVVTFLFLCVAALGAALYIAQRHHSEYLWLALLCLTVAAGGSADAAFGAALMPLTVYSIFTHFSGRIFMAVTLEFVLRFTAVRRSRLVRIVQIAVLLMPFVLCIHLEQGLRHSLGCCRSCVLCACLCSALSGLAARKQRSRRHAPAFLPRRHCGFSRHGPRLRGRHPLAPRAVR